VPWGGTLDTEEKVQNQNLEEGEAVMERQSKWTKHDMKCPEGKGESRLLLEWRMKSGQDVLVSIYCNNPELSDLSGGDCQWSCWEEISSTEE
jgi:hypothetical protein